MSETDPTTTITETDVMTENDSTAMTETDVDALNSALDPNLEQYCARMRSEVVKGDVVSRS